jgi:hypothetical protein
VPVSDRAWWRAVVDEPDPAIAIGPSLCWDVDTMTDTMTDTMWMLQPAAYLRLVRDAGRSGGRYHAWLADLLTRLFLE